MAANMAKNIQDITYQPVASVSSEKRKASTNSDIVSPSSIHVSKILRADDEGIS